MASPIQHVLELSNRLLVRVFGSANDRILETCRPFLERVNACEPTCRGRTDAELRETTTRLRARLAQGATLDDLLPEAFASVREAARRALGMRHYDVQILGGAALHRGMIAEMVTGEGKTLVATCPAYLNAIPGKGVHVVTVNDYLARRDRDWMAPIYEALGMTVGVIQHDLDNAERQRAYGSDITYGTNNEFGFDYLRDNMKTAVREQVHRGYHYAIVDEVDSILIDEARTPLIIAGPSEEATEKYYEADKAVQRLVRKPEGLPPDAEGDWHFIVKEREHQCILTEPGLEECERRLGVSDVYTGATVDWPHHLTEALRAHHLYQRDHHYVVKDGEVIIVDEFTGRLMPGRRWSNGLHQAVEAKEGVRIQAENQTLATITLQNYFKLYGKLAGMTGTAKTEEAEFDKIYKLGVATIPTNRPLIRTPFPDVVYMTEGEKFAAIVEEIVRLHATGRPLLVGTISIEKSEQLSGLLGKRGVPHQVLNAKHHEREAYIVAKAGQMGAVTIATNMAGRGTDIVLGTFTEAELLAHWRENGLAPKAARADLAPDALEALLVPHWVEHFLVPLVEGKDEAKRKAAEDALRALALAEARARLETHWKENRHPILRPCTSVAGLGGLHILGTERHESRRIDNQLRGRAGRQGDPGSSQFFLSLEDKLMRIFAGAWVQAFLRRLGMQEGDDITSPMVSRQIERAQKKVEIHNFEARKNLLEYDEVMNEQRTLIYEMRQDILQRTDQRERVLEMLEHAVREAVTTYVNPEINASERDPAALAAWLRERTGLELPLAEVQAKRPEVLAEELPKRAQAHYRAKAERLAAGAKAAVERRVAETLAAVADGAAVFTDPTASPAARDPGGFTAWYRRRTGAPLDPAELTALAADPATFRETLVARAKARAGVHEREAADGAVAQLETVVLLDVIDAKWKDHLLAMDHLRDSIGLRGYAQVDPKVEYKKEGYQMFREMRDSIRSDVVGRLSRVELPEEPVFTRPPPRMMPPAPAGPPVSREVQAAKREAAAAMGAPPPPAPGAAIPKVGRNDPCPCGSGQKYKKCHGAGAEGGTGLVDGAPTASGAEPPPGTTVPKVGRNQPCPCGSGKKYKQCHGKE